MECKLGCAGQSYLSFLRINRYIMECKCSTRSGSGDADSELIDTLWNVNL